MANTSAFEGIPDSIVPSIPKNGNKTGYNIFCSQRNAELKSTNRKGNYAQQILNEWQTMKVEQPDVVAKFKWIAHEINQLSSATNSKRKLCGWNLYVRDVSKSFASIKDNDVRFRAIADQWKELTAEEKDKFNRRASALEQITL